MKKPTPLHLYQERIEKLVAGDDGILTPSSPRPGLSAYELTR